ncbi:hypothetical protein BpHYR1_011615 [Brachionus plicatilis]|uniref:Uncharacterized protein n=1 Tax=Brachionus plicatilis TaxID=10195 RepID=A0A3M7QYH8_BRAPC|nr:hypothetical protein BpHYR1_011615 [Brachionus plicatilis]
MPAPTNIYLLNEPTFTSPYRNTPRPESPPNNPKDSDPAGASSFTRPVPALSQPQPTIKIYLNLVVNVDAEAILGRLNLGRGRLLNKSAMELRRPAVSVFQSALDLSGPTITTATNRNGSDDDESYEIIEP